ncbi:hypothetical protein PQ610_01765 [Tardisphaera miroshnichenkoae]
MPMAVGIPKEITRAVKPADSSLATGPKMMPSYSRSSRGSSSRGVAGPVRASVLPLSL